MVTVYIPYYTATYSGTLLRKSAAVKINIMMKYYQVNLAKVTYILSEFFLLDN